MTYCPTCFQLIPKNMEAEHIPSGGHGLGKDSSRSTTSSWKDCPRSSNQKCSGEPHWMKDRCRCRQSSLPPRRHARLSRPERRRQGCTPTTNVMTNLMQHTRFCVMHKDMNLYSAKTWQKNFVLFVVTFLYSFRHLNKL